MADPNNIQADQEYRTAIAERGKFFPVDADYLDSIGYPTSGEGKYAILTYSINPGGTTSGGGTGYEFVGIRDASSAGTRVNVNDLQNTNAMSTMVVDASGNQITDFGSSGGVTINEIGDIPQLDAFGRLRVSEVTTAVDLKMLASPREFWIDEIANGVGAISLFIDDDSSVNLSTSNSGEYIIRQEFQRNRYQSGKSQQIFMTFSGLHPETNIIKRVGYFSTITTPLSALTPPYDDNKDGLWIESSNGTMSVCIGHTGTVTSIPQASWNVDKLDGTGPSELTIDWTKAQILAIDFEWLGVGRVRWGLVVDGLVVPFHYSNHSNNAETVYMRSPNQPLRWEIRQTGAGSGAFDQICATVGSEGSKNELGITRSASLVGETSVTIDGVNPCAVIGVRLQDQFIDIPPDFSGFGALCIDNNAYYQWSIWLNATFTPATSANFTWATEPNSTVEIGRGDSANETVIDPDNSTLLITGYGTTKSSVNDIVQQARKLGVAIDGTKDTMILGVQSLGVSIDVYGSIDWVEIG